MKKLSLLNRMAFFLAAFILFASCNRLGGDDDNDKVTIVCLEDSLIAGMPAAAVGENGAAHSYPMYLDAACDVISLP